MMQTVFRKILISTFISFLVAFAPYIAKAEDGTRTERSGRIHKHKVSGLTRLQALSPKHVQTKLVRAKTTIKHINNTQYTKGATRSFAQFAGLSYNLNGQYNDPQSFRPWVGEDQVSDTIKKQRAEAHRLHEAIEKQNKYTDVLDAGALLDLPVGLKKTIGNIEYVVAIKEVSITERGTFLDAFMSFKLPGQDQKIAFRGHNIRFTKDGGLAGEAVLELLGDHNIKLSDKSDLRLLGESTHIVWDCNGFRQFGLDAELSFSRDWIIPVNEQGNVQDGRVSGRITTVLNSWDNFIAGVSLERFHIKNLPDIHFRVSNATFDFSDLNNPPGLTFPENYRSEFGQGSPGLWRGVYLQELEVTLPSYFDKKGENSTNRDQPSRFIISHAIIDRVGFTGLVSKEQLLTLEDGRMGKWAFSLDKLSVRIEANNLAGAAFEGGLIIPAFDEEKPFEYTAAIYPGSEYIFAVSAPKNLSFSLLNAAQIDLRRDSKIQVRAKDNEFIPTAILNGTMGIGNKGDSKFKVAKIQFEQLTLQPVKPYVQVSSLSLGVGEGNKLGDFPVQLNNFGIEKPSQNEIGLRFDITVSLTGKKDKTSYGATGGLVVMGKIEDGEDKQRWRYDRLDVRKLGISIDNGGFTIIGSLEWFKNNPAYGDGMRGEVKLNIIDQFTIESVSLFGAKDNSRYWFVDALASVNVPIATGLSLNTIGGGAMWGMRQSTGGGNLGRTLSGLTYVPDKEMGMQFNAFVRIATTATEAIFNGEVQFRIAFNRHGGLNMVAFNGKAAFINPMLAIDMVGLKGKTAALVERGAGMIPALGAQMEASVSMKYDVPAKTFHANMEVFINIAGGVVKGIGPNNRAGWSVIHFSPGEWYIHAGSPDDPVGLEFLKVARTESYFMMGHHIPASPPPPDELSEILGGVDLDYMSDLNALGEGNGVAFGSRFTMNTGNMTFLMFYGSFSAGMGFDLMLKDYGTTECKGIGQIGINGWYANGQSFAYMEGDIGIKVKIFGKRKKFEIMSLSSGVLMQAKLPNPTWMRGIVGGHFRILGGAIEGECQFEVTIGKACDLIKEGSVLETQEIISDFTPGDKENDVDVFAAPQVVFAMPVNKPFRMIDNDEERKTFRIKLEHLEIRKQGQLIHGKQEWNDRQDVLAFTPHEILSPKATFTMKVKITFEEKVNGSWKPVIVDGDILGEEKQVNFTSGEAPDYIPMHNVASMYPVKKQYNLYKKTSNTGFIKLKRGQSYLFENPEFVARSRFSNIDGGTTDNNLTYDAGPKRVNFTIPDQLANASLYEISMINVPAVADDAVDVNIQEDIQEETIDNGNTVTKRSQQASGNIKRLKEKTLINYYLRTSKYNTFNEKVDGLNLTSGWRRSIRPGVHELGATLKSAEMFDYYEKDGMPEYDIEPLLQFRAVLSNNKYFQNKINPLIYAQYPNEDFKITWRDTGEMGEIPVRGVYLRQYSNGEILVGKDDISSGTTNGSWNGAAIMYNLVHYYEKDYYDLQRQVANAYYSNAGSISDADKAFLEKPFPKIIKGRYDVELRYVLPGNDEPSATKIITIYNPLD